MIFGRIAGFAKNDVKNHGLGAGGGESAQQLRMQRPVPRLKAGFCFSRK